MFARIIKLGCLGLLTGITSVAAQSTLSVPSQFGTIQGAITAASNGDTVLVAPGTYIETLDFLGKAITVRSASGNPESCRLGLQDNMGLCEFPGVRFGQQEGPGSVLEAVTIQNHQDGAGDVGECIDFATVLLTDSSPTLRRVVFRDNAPVEGHGTVVRARGGAPRFEDCVFRGNWGKALELVDSNATVTGCILESNYGGGVSSGATLTVYGGSPLVTSTAIRRNGNLGIGGDVGAGVLVRAGTPTLDGCLIAENYLDGTGAGIVVEPGAHVTVTRTTIAGNRAITGGGPSQGLHPNALRAASRRRTGRACVQSSDRRYRRAFEVLRRRREQEER